MRTPWIVAALAAALGAAQPAQAAPRPDLVVAPPAGLPSGVGTFEGVRVSVQVRNRGTAKAGPTRVALSLSKDAKPGRSDLPFATVLAVKKLAKGGRTKRAGRLVVPAEAPRGRFRVLACVDPDRKVKESSEANNCAASKPVAVAGADPLTVVFARDDARAVTYQAEETTTFSATGADGTFYELEMERAEAEAITALTLTPVTGFTPAPAGVDARHGILIEPAGLVLATPAELRIVPPAGASRAATFAYGFNADGSEFRLEPARFAVEQVSDRGMLPVAAIDVRETGGYGVGPVRATGGSRRAASTPAAGELQLPAASRHQLSQRVAATLQSGDVAGAGPVVCDYYAAVVRPRLKIAEVRGSTEQTLPVLAEALGVDRQLQLLGASEDLACTTDLYTLLGKVVDRLVREAGGRCRAPGGNPFDETVELLTLLRMVELLGTADQPLDGYYDAFALCAPVYDLTYSSSHQTFAPEAWLSSGVATGTAVLDASTSETVSSPLSVPRPDVTYFSGCSGDFDSAQGTLRARARGVFEQRYIGGFVDGRFRPDARVVTEGRLKLVLASDVLALFTFGCSDADPPTPGEFVNHGGNQSRRSVLMAGEGGDGTVSTGDDFARPEPCNPDCQRATATFSVRVAQP